MPEVALPDAFEWVPFTWGPLLRCAPLSAIAAHGFTTRNPALDSGSSTRGDGWPDIAGAVGASPGRLVRLRQVHGTHAVIARRGDGVPAAALDWSEGDVLATDRDDIALCVRVADCVPILLADRVTGAVAGVHAGWRGTAAGASASAVEVLSSQFGCDPANIVAAIGPSIGPCCYRVGGDVRAVFDADGRWTADVDAWFSPSPTAPALCGIPGADPADRGLPSVFLDTWAANAAQLRRAGVPASQVHVSRLCTSCHRGLLHSYRVDGPHAGRMVGVVRKKSGVRSQNSEFRIQNEG